MTKKHSPYLDDLIEDINTMPLSSETNIEDPLVAHVDNLIKRVKRLEQRLIQLELEKKEQTQDQRVF